MSKIKKFFLISLFALFFIPSVGAFSVDSNGTTFVFPDIDNLDNYNYAITYDENSNFGIQIGYCKSKNSFLRSKNPLDSSYSGTEVQYCSNGSKIYRRTLKYFDSSSKTWKSFDYSSFDSSKSFYNFSDSLNYKWSDEVTGIGYSISFRYVDNKPLTWLLWDKVSGSSSFNTKQLIIYSNNDISYISSPYSLVVSSDSFKSDTKVYEKGTYKFDSFAYFIKDFDLGTDKRLKLHFNFMDHIDNNKINIYVNNNGNYILHTLKCLKVSNPKITQCDLDITYNVNNDRSISLFFDFDKVYDFVFFDSDIDNINSGFIPTTDNIKRYSVYRDFSLLNKRGVGFYLDDSRILKFINSSYDFKFYKLIEMCGLINCTPFEVSSSNSFSNDLKGLSYSNTYLNFVNDKFVIPNSSSFLKLSFNNSNLVKFIFNKDLVSNNVFPLFLVLNSDIGNNPNEEVYPNYIVQYNSSIFDYFMIKQNLVLSDDGNYYDDNYESGTTINITDKDGVQKDYTVSPGDSGFQLFSDVDISSYYKNSLDYFKDKIITMFDLVSDLFDSFSVKVKYFFVLMFMLVVGLIIIRLLL